MHRKFSEAICNSCSIYRLWFERFNWCSVKLVRSRKAVGCYCLAHWCFSKTGLWQWLNLWFFYFRSHFSFLKMFLIKSAWICSTKQPSPCPSPPPPFSFSLSKAMLKFLFVHILFIHINVLAFELALCLFILPLTLLLLPHHLLIITHS